MAANFDLHTHTGDDAVRVNVNIYERDAADWFAVFSVEHNDTAARVFLSDPKVLEDIAFHAAAAAREIREGTWRTEKEEVPVSGE